MKSKFDLSPLALVLIAMLVFSLIFLMVATVKMICAFDAVVDEAKASATDNLVYKVTVSSRESNKYEQSTAKSESGAETPAEDAQTPKNIYTDDDVELIAKTLWGECRGVESVENRAAVVWCILNRVDAGKAAGFSDTIKDVVTARYQFLGYRKNNPVDDDLAALAEDVLQRWQREKNGETEVGRVLPKEYFWFRGDGKVNHFRDAFNGKYNVWDFSLESPYVDKCSG